MLKANKQLNKRKIEMDIIIKPEEEILDVDNIAKYIKELHGGDYEKGIEKYKDDKLLYDIDKLQIVIESKWDTDIKGLIADTASEMLDLFIANSEDEIKEAIKELKGEHK